MKPIRRILAPVDFSDPSRAAARYAADLAKSLGGTLELLHVLDVVDYTIFDGAGYAPIPANNEIDKKIEEKLQEEAKAIGDGGPVVEHRMVRGLAYEAIVEAAKNSEADLVVIGTHGRTGFKHLLLGSVAEKVVRLCPVPVLTVKSDDKAGD